MYFRVGRTYYVVVAVRGGGWVWPKGRPSAERGPGQGRGKNGEGSAGENAEEVGTWRQSDTESKLKKTEAESDK